MKNIRHVAKVLLCILALSSCTNEETDEKIDVLKPNDRTQTFEEVLKPRVESIKKAHFEDDCH